MLLNNDTGLNPEKTRTLDSLKVDTKRTGLRK